MPNKAKFVITFAGVVGSSKSPISNYLSTKLNLPIFNNDAIRTEVLEDLKIFDSEEYTSRRNSRLKEVLESGISFICDVSVDREWSKIKEQLLANNYRWYIISLDLSKELLVKLYQVKGYNESLKIIDKLINEHNIFLEENIGDINLHLTDNDFKNRCQIGYKKTSEWINNLI